ncbi:response regulator transcription factor [Candidatus Merdisoma sp. JLR.KK011]|uniref:response regulator transcription factor n=1 Tax=Candidatus Merdisoma sp. JLR.KK011 TaxID=3114299 RepID=UPI002FF33994
MLLINILLVDDHALFSKSLEIALSDYPEIKTFKSIHDISLLDKFIEEDAPDILLMDINLKNITSEDGLELAKQILSNYPEQKIVILSGYDLPVYRNEAKKIGAKGFINKNTEPEKLIAFLSQIMQGKFIFNGSIPFLEELTDCEKQILQLIADGRKRKEIAGTLYISERTLSNHLQHIFEKLDVSSSVEAVTKAIQLGYLPPLC